MQYSTLQIRERAIVAYENDNEIEEICNSFNIHRATAYRWLSKLKRNKTLERRRQPGSGRPPKLNKDQIRKLTRLILKPASKYGYETDFWTSKRIMEIAKKILKITISKTTMNNMLNEERYSYKKPEKRYYEANKKDQKIWVEKTIPEIKKCIKKHRCILYFEDEANVSLDAVLGKTWGPIGKTTIHKTTGNRASVSAMSAINPRGRLIFTLHEKRITSREVINFLDQMLAQHKKRHLAVIIDQAPVHKSKIVKKYIASKKRLHLFYLPARSPEYNADEKVWNYLKNEEMKSHQAKNKGELKKLTRKKLRKMSRNPKLLRALFLRSDVAQFFK